MAKTPTELHIEVLKTLRCGGVTTGQDCDPQWLANATAAHRMIDGAMEAAIAALQRDRDERQRVVLAWAKDSFGEVAGHLEERGARVLEEAIELAQSAGVPRGATASIIDHVYSKPPGEINQELGGLGMTLLALAELAGLSAETEEIREYNRVMALPKEHWQKRHAEKIAAGVANVRGKR